MFHLMSLERQVFNVPLEHLQRTAEIKRIEKAHPPRKVVTEMAEIEVNAPGLRERLFAQKGYAKVIRVDDERLQLLHAFQIMSSPVVTLKPGMNVGDAWLMFVRHGLRHMPVLSEELQIIGIVSERDLLKRLLIRNEGVEHATDQAIHEVMANEVICASAETDIRRIARAMFESHIDTLPIIGPGRNLIGIITRSDILYALVHYGAMKMWA